MPTGKAEIISIKKLKKDGSIENSLLKRIISNIESNAILIMPIDFIYGIVALDTSDNYERIINIVGEEKPFFSRLIPSFKILEELAFIGKLEFDFLHRIWPGEMAVYLKEKKKLYKKLPVRMPKGRVCQEVLNSINTPLLFFPLQNPQKQLVYQKNIIIDTFRDTVACILIIEEFCKEHTLPTLLDISTGDLKIIDEGRISSDEIKSLYFLGRDDTA